MGPPMKGAKEAMEVLAAASHTLIIHTIWTPDRHHVIRDWMLYYGIPFDYITNVKPEADCYIDDRALHFENWQQVLGELSGA